MEVKQQEQGIADSNNKNQQADRVEIIYYTDPLCCWSWGFEPQWRRLLYEYADKIVFRYVMGGLLPSWKNFSDPMYSVSRPMQMGPVWFEASEATGMPMNHKIWVKDPPASSYPACIAVKCAQLQSSSAGVKYLRLLREAVMIDGKNIAKQEVLTNIAQALASSYPNLLNPDKFAGDLTNNNGLEAFRADMNEVQTKGINRFPTLIMKSSTKPAIIMTGYRPYNVLLEAVKQVSPDINPYQKPVSVEAYKKYWGNITQREIDEAFS